MTKRYILKNDYDKVYKDKDQKEWGYYSNKKIKEIFSNKENKSFNVIGEIICDEKNSKGFIENSNSKLFIGNIGANKKIFRKIDGYIECSDNEYVAIVKCDCRKITTSVAIIIMLMSSVVFAINYFKKPEPVKAGPQLADGMKDYVANIERPADWDPSKIALPGFNEIKGKYGTGVVYAALWNPKDNPVYFQYTVILEDSGETLLKTGLIPPGKAVTEIPINKEMQAGTYKLKLKVNTYSLENFEQPMNGGEVKTKLVILK